MWLVIAFSLLFFGGGVRKLAAPHGGICLCAGCGVREGLPAGAKVDAARGWEVPTVVRWWEGNAGFSLLSVRTHDDAA